MVTSSSKTAPSLHFTATSVAMAVPVVRVGAGVNVGRGVTTFVGGRVDVTKRGAEGVFVCNETVMHEVKSRESRMSGIRFFVISKHHHLAFGLFDRVACDLFFKSFTRQYRDIGQGAQ